MKKILSNENFLFSGLQWFYWSGSCIFFSFIVAYLKQKNYTESNIGIVMSVVALMSIIGQPIWGTICDKTHTAKKVLVISLLIGGTTSLLLPLVYSSFIGTFLICIVVSYTANSMPPIIDSWIMKLKENKPYINYGLTRGLGSLGFATTAAIFGKLLDVYGMNLMFYSFLAFLVIASVFSLRIKDETIHEKVTTQDTKNSPMTLFKNFEFTSFLILATLLFTAFRAVQTFYPILLEKVGGTNKDLGLSLFVMALSEAPVLFLSHRLLAKVKDTTLLLASMLFFVIRLYLHIAIDSVEGLIFVQAMQSISFGLFLPAAVHYINRIAPKTLKTTAQTITASAYFGVGSILGSALGGIIIEKYGVYSLMKSGTLLSLVVTIIFSMIILRSKKKLIHG